MDDSDVKVEFEKLDRSRNMGYTLQFFLTVEILLASGTYCFISPYNDNHKAILDIFYLTWMLSLTLSLIPMALATPLLFAKIRIVFRLAFLTAIIFTYCYFRLSLASPLLINYFFCETGYVMHGIYYEQMEWPGKWIAEVTDKWQEWKLDRHDCPDCRIDNVIHSIV